MSMDESKALEILDMKAGVYQRLKEEKKREELLELLGKAMMEQSKQWMDGDRDRIRNEVEDVTVFSNAYHFIVQNCLDETKQKQEEALAMETEEIIGAFSSMSLESKTSLDTPLSWKGGLSAEKGPCLGRWTRYFYNESADDCSVFLFGGCDGNENNFHSILACRVICQKPPEDPISRLIQSTPQHQEKVK